MISKRADKLLVLSVLFLFTYLVIGILFPNFISPFAAAYNLLLDLSLVIGYPGTFIVSFLGNATVLFPFPYIAVPFILGGLTDGAVFIFDPWVIGIVAGFGAMLGEMTSYIIGYGGGSLINENQRNKFKMFIESHPKATPIVLWFLAATPIPDDVLIIPLGAARYPWWKVAVPQFIGKSMFLMGIAWAGRLGLEFVGTLFGGPDPLSFLSRVVEVTALLLVVVAIYLIVQIDWDSVMAKAK